MFAFPVLLGDIGGTNARFAVLPAPGQPMRLLPRMLTAAAPDPVTAIRQALESYDGPAARSAMIAVATRVDSLSVRLTNASWVIDAAAIGAGIGLDTVVLVNDYTPLAASLTALDENRGDLVRLGEAPAARSGTRVVLGPGTGFGAAALVPLGDRLAILATEAGHMEFGPAAADEMDLWPHVERVGGRVSAEAVLSGPGLFRLSKALAASRGEAHPFAAPNDVLTACRSGDTLATDTLRLFARWLGRFAGDLALTFGASGGVYVAGGIAPRMVDVLKSSGFREAFERKAPHEEWAKRVPAFVITHAEPALIGLSVLAANPERFLFERQEWKAAEAVS